MKSLLSLLLLLSGKFLAAQKITEQYTAPKDSLRIGTGKSDFLPYNKKGYTIILPEKNGPPRGILISLEDDQFMLNEKPSMQIYQEATAKGFAVIYISTGIPVDLFFSLNSLLYVDNTLKYLFSNYNLPAKNIFFLGVNLAGHRALKYIEYCKQEKSIFRPEVQGVILCDGVLDWIRQWYEGKKGIRDKFASSSVFEGNLVTYLLESNLHGTPKNNPEKYLDFSMYSYFDEKNRHIGLFKGYAFRAYSEPATHYWSGEKGKTTFDTNFPDMVGLINELKLAGNTRSELVLFHQDKNLKDSRNPNYTFGLVDKKELIGWMITHCK